MHPLHSRTAFTLIELLVVIAIIAILAVVVVLTLNPAQLLAESRDSNRLSDFATINSALGIYGEDVGAGIHSSYGVPQTAYLSLFDPAATSTQGTGCQGVGMPPLTTYGYHCAASSTLRDTNGTGWIPVNFSQISSGAPFGTVPIDPVNQTSSNLYYTYATDGVRYVLSGGLESQKYLKQYLLATNPDPTRYAVGTNISLVAKEEGLVDYWNLDEGNGMTAIDQSGNGNNGTWSGTSAGTSGYYAKGKVGPWAGDFNGSNDYVALPDPAGVVSSSVAAWFETGSDGGIFGDANAAVGGSPTSYNPILYVGTDYKLRGGIYNMSGTPVNMLYSSGVVNDNAWHFAVWTYDGTTQYLYLDGVLQMTATLPAVDAGFLNYVSLGVGNSSNWTNGNGGWFYFNGLIDDARVYNRALSAAEVRAMYNAEK